MQKRLDPSLHFSDADFSKLYNVHYYAYWRIAMPWSEAAQASLEPTCGGDAVTTELGS